MANWKVICDRCGFQYWDYELFKEWTGYLVCRKCIDPKDFELRIKPERSITPITEPDRQLPYSLLVPSLASGQINITGGIFTVGLPLGSGTVAITGTNVNLFPQGFILVAGGQTAISGGASKTSEKYNDFEETIEAGTSLNDTVDACQGICTSEQSVLCGLTSTGDAHDQYIHATDTVTQKTGTLTDSRFYVGSASNSTQGVFAGGYDNSVTYDTVDRYVFSTNTISASATALSANRYEWGQGAGKSDVALIIGGRKSGTVTNTSEKYTYADDTMSTAVDTLSVPRTAQCAFGNLTMAYSCDGLEGGFFGFWNITEGYTYSTNTWETLFSGGHSNDNSLVEGASSTPLRGIIASGQLNGGGTLRNITRVNFTDGTKSNSPVSLVTAKQSCSVTSSSPGWI